MSLIKSFLTCSLLSLVLRMFSTELYLKVHESCNSIYFSITESTSYSLGGKMFSFLVASLLTYLSLVCCILPFMALIIEGNLWLTSWASCLPPHGKHKQRKLLSISETTLHRVSQTQHILAAPPTTFLILTTAFENISSVFNLLFEFPLLTGCLYLDKIPVLDMLTTSTNWLLVQLIHCTLWWYTWFTCW